VILALAAVLVIAVAIPAFGSGGSLFNLASHANSKAERALHRAKRALKRASRGLKRGHNARLAAGAVSQQLGGTRIASAAASGQVTTTAPPGSYESLGGPTVQATVPSSGLIEVWAQAEILDDNGGAVALYEDGRAVPGGTDALCDGVEDALFIVFGFGTGEFDTFSTPATPSFPGCTSTGAAAPVIFQRPPGPHTYELRYSDCGCGGGGTFRDRLLRVAPRL
jgi:hypothetical protein